MNTSCAESIPSFAGAFDYCAPNFVFGEIEEMIVAPLDVEGGDPFPADWLDEDSWDELLNPTVGSPIDRIRVTSMVTKRAIKRLPPASEIMPAASFKPTPVK